MEDEVYNTIDSFLQRLVQRNGQCPANFIDDAKGREVLRLIDKYHFADIPSGNIMTHNFFLTIEGENVIKGAKSKRYIQEKQKNEQIKTQQTASKLMYEAKTAKWMYYTYWVGFGISLLGFGLSIYNFLHALK